MLLRPSHASIICATTFWILSSQAIAQDGIELAVFGQDKPASEIARGLSTYVEGWLSQDEDHVPEWNTSQVGNFATALKSHDKVDVLPKRVQTLTESSPPGMVRAYSVNIKAFAKQLKLTKAIDEYYRDSPPLFPAMLKKLASNVENLEVFITEDGKGSASIQLDFELDEAATRRVARVFPLKNQIASLGETKQNSLFLNFDGKSIFNAIGEWADIHYQRPEKLCETLQKIDSNSEEELIANTFGKLTGRALFVEASDKSIVLGFEHSQQNLNKMKSSLSEILEKHFSLKQLNWRTANDRRDLSIVEFNEKLIAVGKRFVYLSLDRELNVASAELEKIFNGTKFSADGASARGKMPLPDIYQVGIARELQMLISKLCQKKLYMPEMDFGSFHVSKTSDLSIYVVKPNKIRVLIEFSIERE